MINFLKLLLKEKRKIKMAEHIHKCLLCGKYSLDKKCNSCSKENIIPRPPKFSLDDKYAKLKREAKKEELKEKNLY